MRSSSVSRRLFLILAVGHPKKRLTDRGIPVVRHQPRWIHYIRRDVADR